MQAPALVEQQALGALKDQGLVAEQRAQVIILDALQGQDRRAGRAQPSGRRAGVGPQRPGLGGRRRQPGGGVGGPRVGGLGRQQRGQLCGQRRADGVEAGARHPRAREVPRAEGQGGVEQRKPGRLAHPEPAAAVAPSAARRLAQAVGRLVVGGDDQRLAVHHEPVVAEAERVDAPPLDRQRQRVQQEARPEQARDPRHEEPGPHLRADVRPPVGVDHPVPGLRAAVPAHDPAGPRAATEQVDDAALAAVSKPQIDDRPGLGHQDP